ncbi:hypothetical protein T11_14796 [Trichinella zimbabwensis]|uniref:Uncharacterized protein n=1 Tax=Trichinella zimbabwensis TaxID=268475 RepID=A0A0V1H0P4_9BILA|nr:hypothetical protein T11_14796 [Trichinella zimbabwensis]
MIFLYLLKLREIRDGRSYIKAWTKQTRIIVVECEDEARAIVCDQSEVEFRRRIYDLDVVAIISLESSLSCPKSQ